MKMIVDLREQPGFLGIVAERIWRAWWRNNSKSLADLRDDVALGLGPAAVPSVLVAREAGRFLGTASIIDNDLSIRPQYSPWVAAVWVEPEARHRGVGRQLVSAAARAIFAAGFPRAYLCAHPEKVSFYTALGWQPIEAEVGEHCLTICTLNLGDTTL